MDQTDNSSEEVTHGSEKPVEHALRKVRVAAAAKATELIDVVREDNPNMAEDEVAAVAISTATAVGEMAESDESNDSDSSSSSIGTSSTSDAGSGDGAGDDEGGADNASVSVMTGRARGGHDPDVVRVEWESVACKSCGLEAGQLKVLDGHHRIPTVYCRVRNLDGSWPEQGSRFTRRRLSMDGGIEESTRKWGRRWVRQWKMCCGPHVR